MSLFACGNPGNEGGTQQTLTVDHYRTSCTGLGARGCYQTNVGLFYEDIENFNYEWGHSYTLDVNVSEVDDPLQDSSSLRYQLTEVVRDDAVPPETTFEVVVFDAELIGPGSTTSYSLFSEKDFDCASLCGDLEQKLDALKSGADPMTNRATLQFRHGSASSNPLLLVGIGESSAD